MIVELADELEAALRFRAGERGVSPAGYVNEVLKRDLGSSLEPEVPNRPFKTAYGSLAKYGPAPSAEEIDENRADMLCGLNLTGLEGVSRVRRMADYVWDDPVEAGRWLERSHPLLDGNAPLLEAKTEVGRARVERILWNILHGLPV